MDIFGTARGIYMATRDNLIAVAKIRAEYADLSIAIATDQGASQTVTSGTINGQTFTAGQAMTQLQRHSILRLVVNMYDANQPVSNVVKPYF
jgi:hypothetical protein